MKRKRKSKAKEKKEKTLLNNILQHKPPPKYSVLQQSKEETFWNLKSAPSAGRPKGNTNAAEEERDQKFTEMKNAITIVWAH